MPFTKSRSITLALMLVLAAQSYAAANTDPGKEIQETADRSTLSGSYLAAQIATKSNDDEAAVVFYQRSLALDPENDQLKLMLFLALSANGRIEDAVAIARERLPETEEASFARLVLAVDALKRKSWAQVGDLLSTRANTELDRMVEELLNAWAAYGNGDPKKAIAIATEFDGPDWVGMIRSYHAGLIAAAAGDDAAAISYFQQSTENKSLVPVLTETYLRAMEAQVLAQMRTGDKAAAKETLDAGLDVLPTHPPFLRLKTELEDGKAPTPLVTSAPQGGAEIFYNVGSAISRQGGAPIAQSYLQLAHYLRPDADFLAVAIASLFEKQDNHARANSYYDKIKSESAYFRRSQIEYALNLNDMKQVDEAKKVMRDLIETDPDDLLAYSTLGGILSQHEEFEEAAKVYDEAVARLGDSQEQYWNLYYRRGIAYERIKQWDKAEPNFKKSLELSPDQPNVLNYLGYSWIDMGINLEEGLAMVKKAVDMQPRSGFIVDSLGWAYYRLGRYKDAVDELERAVEIMPEDPVINDHLGDAYWRVGRRLEATFQWNHALNFDPEIEERIKIRLKLKNGLGDTDDGNTASKE